MTRSSTTDARARRRARLTLAAIGLAVITLLLLAAAVFLAHRSSAPAAGGREPGTSAPPVGGSGRPGSGDADALAGRPMLALPAQAAQPQTLTTQTAGSPIPLPAATVTTGVWIPGGFPRTPEGALAQLKALDETAMAAGDPQVYARGYAEVSVPGAPAADSTGLVTLLRNLRSHAGLPSTGSVTDFTVTYRVTHGLVKGSAEGGDFVVACVLGPLAADYQGQVVTAGVGDCQALRWQGDRWRIAPGALAAAAPSAWPGSADAVKAGYRELS